MLRAYCHLMPCYDDVDDNDDDDDNDDVDDDGVLLFVQWLLVCG